MSVLSISSRLNDLGLASVSVKNSSLSKLIVYVTGFVDDSPTISNTLSSKICEIYGGNHCAQEQLDLRINVEALKWLRNIQYQRSENEVFVNKQVNNVNTLYKLPTRLLADPVTWHSNVVLGGTFDRLHAGHKILLTEAVMRCTKKLTVGVTDESMIKSKKLWELIEPVEKRIGNVLEFLRDVDSRLCYDVVPISDMYGPTRTDPDLQMLVVSAETEGGGHKVNQVREEKGFPPMELYVVKLLKFEKQNDADEDKVSSSNGRLRLLGTRLRPPKPKPNIPSKPYLIGLTGGIASGKSNVARLLSLKGAGVVNCDRVAHDLYKPGTKIYDSIIDAFGANVLGKDGEIDRKILGEIVFGSKEQLEKLNNLVWPEILKKSLEEAQRLYREEHKTVVVLEAAVLLRGGWFNDVHEVWCCIVPPDEAVKRVMERNKLDKESAEARLKAQPTNSEQVAVANVVFTSLHSYEFTETLVDRAWQGLQDHIKHSMDHKL